VSDEKNEEPVHIRLFTTRQRMDTPLITEQQGTAADRNQGSIQPKQTNREA